MSDYYYFKDEAEYLEIRKKFENYSLGSAAIYNKDVIYVTLEWSYGKDAGSITIAKFDNRAETKWQAIHISHYERHKLAIDFRRNEVLASSGDDGWSDDEGTHYFLHPVAKPLSAYQYPTGQSKSLYPNWGFRQFNVIDRQLHAFGGGAAWVIKREESGDWVPISINGLPRKKDDRGIARVQAKGRAFDAFNHDDIYICGPEGNLWHFNGERWKRLDIPTMANLVAVVCVKDGRIAVFESHGAIWIGEGDKFLRVGEIPTFQVYCATFFDNKVWVGAKLGLYVLDLDKPKAEFESVDIMPSGAQYFHDNGDQLIMGATGKIIVYDRLADDFEQFMSW